MASENGQSGPGQTGSNAGKVKDDGGDGDKISGTDGGNSISSSRSNGRLAVLALGNFTYGTSIMMLIGLLDLIAADYQVSPAAVGMLFGIFSFTLCIAGPVIGNLTARIDRRLLLSVSLAVYALINLASAFIPNYELFLASRVAVALVGAAFVPQVAATAGMMVPVEERGRAMTFAYLGFAMVMVIGIPLSRWCGDLFGWRVALGLASVAGLTVAVLLWFSVPSGLRSQPLDRHGWLKVFTHPVMVTFILVTALQGAAQNGFTIYITVVARDAFDASSQSIARLFLVLGASALIGQLLGVRIAHRFGAVHASMFALVTVFVGMVLWIPAFGGQPAFAFVGMAIWGLGTTTAMSAQQVRLYNFAPDLASVSMALNSSALYLSNAIGASLGGAVIEGAGTYYLPWVCAPLMLAAMVLSLAGERLRRRQHRSDTTRDH